MLRALNGYLKTRYNCLSGKIFHSKKYFYFYEEAFQEVHATVSDNLAAVKAC